MNQTAKELLTKIESHDALVGIIGLGYVGLPLALCFTERGFNVLGFDIDPNKVEMLTRGESYIKHLDETRLKKATGNLRSDKTMEATNQTNENQATTSAMKCDECDDNSSFIIHNSSLNDVHNSSLLRATTDFTRLKECDAILICVPTPLGPHKEPDLSYVENSTKEIKRTLREGQLIILESTTYPGTTDELLREILESKSKDNVNENEYSSGAMKSDESDGCDESDESDEKLRIKNSELRIDERIKNLELRIGDDSDECDDNSSFIIHNSSLNKDANEKLECGSGFFLAFSPEREDPGNPDFGTRNIPKVVGGVDEVSGDLAEALYAEVLDSTVRVKNARTAESTKLMENIFRSVNIALVNELKMVFEKMDVDIWDVLDAAETKPFGFMRFNPGPGLGGHCIPLDPFYLAWKARESGQPTRFIELAGEINTQLPVNVIEKVTQGLNQHGKSVKGSKVLILGMAYKPNIDDPRESPAFELIQRLLALGAEVNYHDPHIPEAPSMRSWPNLPPMTSAPLTKENLKATDAVILATDHDQVDYDLVLEHAALIIDTRGVYKNKNATVHKA